MDIDPNQCPACLGYKPMIVSLCGECLDVHGTSATDWPEWVRALVNDNKRISRWDDFEEEEIDEIAVYDIIDHSASAFDGRTYVLSLDGNRHTFGGPVCR